MAAKTTPTNDYGAYELTFTNIEVSNQSAFTLGTILLGAWGLAIRHFDSQDRDIYVMRLSSGRQAPVARLENTPGLCTVEMPMPVRIKKSQSISEFLSELQNHCSESVPYEHFGVENIANLLPEDEINDILDPSTLMIPHAVQTSGTGENTNVASLMEHAPEVWQPEESIRGFTTSNLSMHCQLRQDSIQISASHRASVLSSAEVKALYEYLESAVLAICEHQETGVSELIDHLDSKHPLI
uniref:Condensation domain-containing protein n=1 Tax=Bionectria ochroleuca TaxID=29856 RepID=A0A8H7N3H1_BIOOC